MKAVSRTSSLRRLCLLLISLLALPALLFAQSAGVGSISGVVEDSTGAVVPGAHVVLDNTAKGIHRETDSSSAGVFNFAALIPAAGYSVTVSKTGFADYVVKDITVQVGSNVDFHTALRIAASGTEVQVTGEAPLVDPTKTEASSVVDQHQIQDLPINGRRVDSFVLLTPGVSNDFVYGLLTFRGVAGQNAFLVDGVDTTEGFYGENAGRTRIATQISQDAVDQFQVVSSNYSAEFGHAMGGVVNTVTKSGGNAVHGNAYWFYRSTGFNAKDYFAAFNPSEKRNQMGGNVGGPIIKDKLFYFLNFEATRRNFPMVSSINSGNAVDGTTQTWKLCGVASGGFPAATAAQCAAINGLLPRFYGTIPRTLNQELYLAKLDYHLNDRNTLSASFNFLHSISPNGIQSGAVSTSGSALTSNGDDYVTVKNGRIQWLTTPTNSLSNEFRFGLAADRQADSPNPALTGEGLGLLAVSVYGTSIGTTNYLPRVEPNERRFQFTDNLTWVKGRHTFKFGADIATTHDYVYYVSNYNGSYTYQNVNAFALDYSGNDGTKHWGTYAQTFGKPDIAFTQNDWAVYAQDQWRATDKLVLTLGARYEYTQIPQPKVCNPDYPETCHVASDNLNLAPRIGITYQLDPKTVLQAGFGMFFARLQGGTLDNLYTSGNGLYQTGISLSSTQSAQLAAGPSFPNVLPSIPTAAKVAAASLQYMAPGVRTPYSEQANFGIQHEIAKNTVLNVSYLWSRGLQLWGVRDVNLPTTTTPFTYKIQDEHGTQTGTYTTDILTGTRPDTRYGAVWLNENAINSYYNALSAQLNQRFSHGITAMASYTWAHEIDDGQQYGGGTNNLFLSNGWYWLNNGDYKADKGSGNLDQRHRFVLSWAWGPKFTNRTDAFSRYLINGWQLSNITTLATGHPSGSLTAYKNSTKDVPGMFSTYSLNGTGYSSRVPWLPVNSYYLPGFYRADMRLSKIIPIGEAEGPMKLALNFDVFNVANNWSATSYKTSQAYTEVSTGVLKQTPTVPTPGATLLYTPSADALNPDGTQARRLQVSARFTF